MFRLGCKYPVLLRRSKFTETSLISHVTGIGILPLRTFKYEKKNTPSRASLCWTDYCSLCRGLVKQGVLDIRPSRRLCSRLIWQGYTQRGCTPMRLYHRSYRGAGCVYCVRVPKCNICRKSGPLVARYLAR